MKYTAKGLTGEKFGIKLFFPHETRYYYAKNRSTGANFLWLETKRLGTVFSYPFMIASATERHEFLRDTQPDAQQNNRQLVERWNALIDADTLAHECDWHRLDESEFAAMRDRLTEQTLGLE